MPPPATAMISPAVSLVLAKKGSFSRMEQKKGERNEIRKVCLPCSFAFGDGKKSRLVKMKVAYLDDTNLK